ncbi:hypothetical protein P9E76_00050 [Schinkia azotoformans]|uniref:Uncharacterized protein n=1 Tax=Schinkia azotoformans LMG 9581 TaxID=1131731 RepID=K6D993_SCHAZ|nr:hypothetical protein [Schinkia azotoformans]EKN64648.1 hypothetical protein BAZO_12884 [Schinkia azotoformans LMG 9581]MEC1640039.1 hypothetical protein [Schinkia azotoformans]MEC1722644.1 hypothetical protein [Schinkia azotoformans]MEC1943477.1 hypothetical protein [Schinkia azotoformans]MED4415401.1 hypothetical protein [Schinkia azotoformans]
MIQQLNTELKVVKEKMRKKEKWEARLKNVLETIKDEEEKLQHVQHQFEKEQKDVDRLESLSVASIFYALIGQKLEKLDKENQELIAARLKLQEATKTATDLKEESKELQEKLSTVANIETEYQSLLMRKEKLIHSQDPVLGQKLDALLELETDLHSNLKEHEEAIEAGEKASSSLEKALKSLDSAKGWSTFDMFGGGMISTAIKHSHINDSRDEIHHAQRALRHFQEELKDVEKANQSNFKISGLLTFVDYFFDGIIVDWFVHGHIQDSYEQTSKILNQVATTLSQLKEKYDEIKNNLSITERKRISLIENMG